MHDIREFFVKNSASVEVVASSGVLVKVSFPRPIVCHYLTKKTKARLQWSFDLSTDDTKHYSLFESLDVAHDEMQHRHRVSRGSFVASVVANLDVWKNVSLMLAILLNVLILLGFGVDTPVRGPAYLVGVRVLASAPPTCPPPCPV